MTVLRRVAPAGAALCLLLAVAAGDVRTGLAAPPRPTILAAAPDLAAGTLTIHGHGLAGGGTAPQVTLAGADLVVVSATDETVVAELPPGSAGRNHLLVVRSGNRSDSAAIWIPGEGIVTRGAIRIESTESDVRVIAGGSRVTVDPAGGIRIESTGPLDLRTSGALDLRGQSVTIRSATGLTLEAGLGMTAKANTMDVEATSVMNLKAGGQMNLDAAVIDVAAQGTASVTGSLVRLN